MIRIITIVIFLFISPQIFAFDTHAEWVANELAQEANCEQQGGTYTRGRRTILTGKIIQHGHCELPDEDEDTWSIIEETLKCDDCFDWSLMGVCFWLDIEVIPPSATVRTSALVKNFLPDFVVTAYSNQSPYPEMGGIVKRENGAIQTEKNDTYVGTNEIDTNLDFKHVDIITNPAIPIYNQIGDSFSWSCKSVEKIPYFPHYVSDKDPAWEAPIVEQLYPQALLGFPRMSRLPHYWGPIYPRTGWTSLPHDAMSALVVAERASEIVTGGFSVHVFFPPGNDCGNKCWPPDPVKVDDWENRFQQIYPSEHVDTDAAPLPRNASWINGREYPNQKYAWVLWRRYECCKEEGEIFIERVVIDGDYGGNGRGHEAGRH
ncbi:hypothetical protein MARGE09_P1954 [Marinagarivorans cellulosilyticus]|uniref:TIGR03756 family integrating conjugative element protein n=1 Tax=Marinagarivorans cellulosilyticus TaxID=2721545 RepID=A0AAN1WHL1_9GAMM|nr:hypothetical protein MARGE09_P1954 [Marinagarivorans cellulosilyticus]